jgi:hypothetical protein
MAVTIDIENGMIYIHGINMTGQRPVLVAEK